MVTFRTENELQHGVPGVAFRTDARPDTAAERKLQEYQSQLSGGNTIIGSSPTFAHLYLERVMEVG
jgi:hypothetical protein